MSWNILNEFLPELLSLRSVSKWGLAWLPWLSVTSFSQAAPSTEQHLPSQPQYHCSINHLISMHGFSRISICRPPYYLSSGPSFLMDRYFLNSVIVYRFDMLRSHWNGSSEFESIILAMLYKGVLAAATTQQPLPFLQTSRPRRPASLSRPVLSWSIWHTSPRWRCEHSFSDTLLWHILSYKTGHSTRYLSPTPPSRLYHRMETLMQSNCIPTPLSVSCYCPVYAHPSNA